MKSAHLVILVLFAAGVAINGRQLANNQMDTEQVSVFDWSNMNEVVIRPAETNVADPGSWCPPTNCDDNLKCCVLSEWFICVPYTDPCPTP